MTTAAMSDEEVVRGAWELAALQEDPERFPLDDGWHSAYRISALGVILTDWVLTPELAWSAARVYTDEVIEEARQMREDLQWVKNARIVDSPAKYAMDAKRRTVKRLELLYVERVCGLKAEALK